MNLIIDIGNSRMKVVAIEGMEILGTEVCESLDTKWLRHVVSLYPKAYRAILSSTRGEVEQVEATLRECIDSVISFRPGITPIPIGNDYLTPTTLGADRLAAAVGAAALYPDSDIMIVDFGTAITIDYVENGIFKGGNISPGMTTRFRALADYTASLPLCSASDEQLSYGRTTQQAIEQGVMQGITHEIEGYIEAFSKKKGKKYIIFTGGDAKYFAMRIKNAIFADCEPVVYGLSRILDYNAV
ncbi:MAG: type III pantothenate kinase [Alistipes sp.]|nr:type III pantothenate kinase [Alistipes sp.]